jgi:Tol biopolymer transport system component
VAVLGLALAASLAVTWTQWSEAPAARAPVRFTVAPPAPYVMGLQIPALSPDGARLAFTASRPGEPAELFVRDFAAAEAAVVPETAGASSPFWSPDGRRVAFFSGRKLMKVALGGGPPVTLADGTCCGTWGREGEILFTHAELDSPNSVIMRVSSEGGVASPALRPDPARGENGVRAPVFLPDSRHFLYEVSSARADVQGTYLASPDSAGSSRVMPDAANVAFVPPGLLVYRSGGRLLAQELDWNQPRLIGNAIQLSDAVGGAGVSGTALRAYFDATPGALAYIPGSATPSVLVWVDRQGNRVGGVGGPGDYYSPAISPDWKTVAVGRTDPATQTRDIWLIDLERGTQSRLTSDPADDINPTWSPDGRRIAFSSARRGQRDIYVKAASGIGEEQPVLAQLGDKNMECWSADGRVLFYNTRGTRGQTQQIWAVPVEGERPPYAVVSGPAAMSSSSLSPDGRFIAYYSTESGRAEIFLETLPRGRERWQISTAGGFSPRWRADGRELFYTQGDALMAVDIKDNAGRLVPGVPHELFKAPFVTAGRNVFFPSRDGARFLAALRVEPVGNPSITVELNWTSRLAR